MKRPSGCTSKKPAAAEELGGPSNDEDDCEDEGEEEEEHEEDPEEEDPEEEGVGQPDGAEDAEVKKRPAVAHAAASKRPSGTETFYDLSMPKSFVFDKYRQE
eukprot:803583-Pyramimonas_sp.AAC.1